MTASTPTNQPIYGTAKRLRRSAEAVPNGIATFANMVVMVVVVCGDCGERFALQHRRNSQDLNLAERQAAWLKDRFVWDHIQESRHSGSIALLGPHQMKSPIPAN